jgi:hypothetical protein
MKFVPTKLILQQILAITWTDVHRNIYVHSVEQYGTVPFRKGPYKIT